MLPQEASLERELRQAIARIRQEYQSRLVGVDPKTARKLHREMDAKVRRERMKIQLKHALTARLPIIH